MKAIQLYNLSVARGNKAKEIILRNVHYGIAAMERKKLIASGTMRRNCWIEKIDLPNKTVLSKK
jgi:hypothetical protein